MNIRKRRMEFSGNGAARPARFLPVRRWLERRVRVLRCLGILAFIISVLLGAAHGHDLGSRVFGATFNGILGVLIFLRPARRMRARSSESN